MTLEQCLDSLGQLLAICVEDRPLFAIGGLKFDEATQKLALQLSSSLKAKHQASSWNTALSRQILAVGWQNGQVIAIPVIRPPVPILDTSASAICEALEAR